MLIIVFLVETCVCSTCLYCSDKHSDVTMILVFPVLLFKGSHIWQVIFGIVIFSPVGLEGRHNVDSVLLYVTCLASRLGENIPTLYFCLLLLSSGFLLYLERTDHNSLDILFC